VTSILSIEFLQSLLGGIVTLFVILDPIGVVPFFQSFTRRLTSSQRQKVAKRSVLIAMLLLLIFAYLGQALLTLLGITIYDFEIAGGALLLVFAIRDALSNEPLGATESSAAIAKNEHAFESIAVIPLATPLLAGPGSLTTSILLANSDLGYIIAGIAILVDSALAFVALRMSERLNKLVGPSGLMIISKVLDILMAAIAVSYLARGLVGAGF
jgi:multiple antibiotic resistance protein